MKPWQSVNSMLLLFWFDVFSLSLISLVSFLYIGENFLGISFLGLALSLRTLSSAVSSHFMGALTAKINAKQLLIYTQILSFLVVFVLLVGFVSKNKVLILFGITALGIPYVVKNVFLTIYFKFLNAHDDAFRKKSGQREFIFGLARLCACIASPLLLFYFDIKIIAIGVMLISLLGLLFSFAIPFFPSIETSSNENKTGVLKVLLHPATWEYICKCTSVLLLVSFIAILAASGGQLFFSVHIPKIWRQLLWSIEALTMMIGSAIYIKRKMFLRKRFVHLIIMLNSVFLLLLLLSDGTIMLLAVSAILSLSIMIGFYVFRDDYVLMAGSDGELIRGFSSFSAVQQYLIYSISPLFLTYLFGHYNLRFVIFTVLILQATLLVLSISISCAFKKRKFGHTFLEVG